MKRILMLVSAFILVGLNLQAQDAKPTEIFIPETSESSTEGAIKTPKVSFVSPKDGATVKQKFKVKFKVEGMKAKAAGVMDIGTGHHHLIVDGAAIPKGQVVPKDEKNIHYGKGESNAELSLTPGSHTLTLQFADGSHISYGPELSQTITVTVK